MKTSLYRTVAFTVGFSTMTLELLASRAMAPYLGTSFVVWTNLIGVCLGGLSIGYFWGGRMADRHASRSLLARLLLLLTVLLAGISLFYQGLLMYISIHIGNLTVSTFLNALLLFGPVNVVFGMLTPLTVKLELKGKGKEASTVGLLYALAALGNILGVFLTGLVFIPRFGVHTLFVLLVGVNGLLFVVTTTRKRLFATFAAVSLMLVSILLPKAWKSRGVKSIYESETQYNHLSIFFANPEGEIMKILKINNDYSSATFLKNNNLAFAYTTFFRLSKHFNPEVKSALMIGGGAYSYPMQFLKDFPRASMTVVELDPGVTKAAREFFNLKQDIRLTSIHEDGRLFLNREKGQYDVLFIDAFDNNAVPYQLTTVEALIHMKRMLTHEGFVMLNLISTLDGKGSQFLKSQYKTYRSVFPSVYLFPVHGYQNKNQLQSMILVAFNKKTPLSKETDDALFKPMLRNHFSLSEDPRAILLTDDFAPVEYYISKTY